MEENYSNGDVLLRGGCGRLISILTKSEYTHAGICVDKSNCVDALDRKPENAIKKISIKEFFDPRLAPGTHGIYRYKNSPQDAENAAVWAEQQCGNAHYNFNIFDPIVGPTNDVVLNDELYCSEFVWRSYREGAGVDLVLPHEFLDLFSDENREESIKAAVKHVKEDKLYAKFPDSIIEKMVVKKIKSMQNGFFIAPSQLADSPLLEKVTVKENDNA